MNYYIKIPDYINWLLNGSDREFMIKWLGEEVESSLLKGEQYIFNFHDSLQYNLSILPTSLLHDIDGNSAFPDWLDCELDEIEGEYRKIVDAIYSGKSKVTLIPDNKSKSEVVYHVKTENGFMIKVDDGYGYDEVHDMNDPRVAVFNNSHEAREHCEFHNEVVIDSNWKYLEQTGTYECADCFRLSRLPIDEVDDCDTCENTGEVTYND